MSGPDTTHPTQVDSLAPAALDAAVAEALAAFAAAADLDQLKTARLTHAGDRSHWRWPTGGSVRWPRRTRPRPASGSAPPVAGSREALDRRTAELEAERDQQVLREEVVDVTLPARRDARRRPAPDRLLMEEIGDLFVGDGLGDRRGAGGRSRVVQLRRTELRPRPSGPADAGHVLRRATGGGTGPANPHLAGAGADTARTRRTGLRGVPGRTFRTDELDATHTPVFHQVEGLAVDRGLTMAHLKGTLDHLARAMFDESVETRLRPAFFPFTEPSAEMDLRCFSVGGPTVPAAPARARRGSNGAAAGWSIRTSSPPVASIPRFTPGSRSAWESSAR